MSSPEHDAELAAWLRLSALPGLNPATARALVEAFGAPELIFEQSWDSLAKACSPALADAVLRAPTKADAAAQARAFAWAAQPSQYLLTLADARYPRALLAIPDPPLVLYLRGRLEQLAAPALAIVGSRQASAQGAANALHLAHALSDAGLTIVSGLALGIDGAAHRGALRGAASTVAVLGTGVDVVYPAQHRALAAEIAARGALLSEWPLGTPPRAAHFPRRNRLLAGLARGVLVVEAAARSGSLITARLAGEFGRDVLAIPGSIHAPLARGCHRLLKDGAQLVESVDDVLSALGLTAKVAAGSTSSARTAGLAGLSRTARRLLDALGHDPASRNMLAHRLACPEADLHTALLELEMAGCIAALPGARFARVFPSQAV